MAIKFFGFVIFTFILEMIIYGIYYLFKFFKRKVKKGEKNGVYS